MAGYFENLRGDLTLLGLTDDLTPGQSVWDREAVDELLACTQEIGPSKSPLASQHTKELKTAFGREIAELILDEEGLEFYINKSVDCCAGTEDKLLDNISPDSVANPDFTSPIILTRDGKPYGIVKGLGETTCYAMNTDRQSGLVAGTLCTVPGYMMQGKKPPAADHAWLAPLEWVEGFSPVRFSLFHLPAQAKAAIAGSATDPVLTTTPAQIMARAKEMLVTATELPDGAVVRMNRRD